jgi:multimeric flavodoxin WrbA
MSKKVQEINMMFNIIDTKITGGTTDTEPYNTFRSSLNKIYDYFSVIFVNEKINNEKYKSSIDNLDKPCDCSKYKCKQQESEEDSNIEESDIEEDNNVHERDMKEIEKNNEEKKESKLLLKTSKIK